MEPFEMIDGGKKLHQKEITDPKGIMEFIKGGNAVFTLRGVEKRFTFKVTRPKSDNEDRDFFFVGILSGPDNVSDYTYMGVIDGRTFRLTKKSRVTEDADSFKAFRWFFNMLKEGRPLTPMEFWHAGRCARCGRELTVPESIASGFGPECIKHVGGPQKEFQFG